MSSCVVNCVAFPRLLIRLQGGSNPSSLLNFTAKSKAKVCSNLVTFQNQSQRQRVVSATAVSEDVNAENTGTPLRRQSYCYSNSQHDDKFVEEIEVKKQAVLARELKRMVIRSGSTANTTSASSWDLNEAYDRCVELAAEDVSSFLLATSTHSVSLLTATISFLIKMALLLRNSEEIKAFAAVAVWGRRTDELVDGINGSCTTLEVLDRWEQRLIELFDGQPPLDMYDAALFDAITKYPIDIELFKDLIEGMRLDLKKSRYENFNELCIYFYHVAGTVALMIVQLMVRKISSAPAESMANSRESVYNAALAFAFATQLTDILRDIPEDAKMGRIYLPQDELARAGLSDDDIYSGKVTDKWRNFMKTQIRRAKMYCDEGEKLADKLNLEDRWLIWSVTLINRQILASIEANDYSFTNKVSVGIPKQVMTFLAAHGISLAGSSSNFVELTKVFLLFCP